MRTPLFASLIAIALVACQPSTTPTEPATAGDADHSAAAAPAPSSPYTLQPWSMPTPANAAQPDLVAAADGSLLLSWIAAAGDGHALQFARYRDGEWGAARTIAHGDDWFVNWADTPHIAATADGALWAHWLQKSAAATYAYDVALVRSDDDGATWSEPRLVNDDGTPTEHGFVAMWPASADSLGIAWLDGRATAGGGHDTHAAHAGAGMMTLRSARFDAELGRSGETVLDASTCDCCQTDAALTARGPLLVYRDRTTEEIRDIAVTRFDGERWTDPARVHADGWKMPACPVNGPTIDARDSEVVVGWYTATGGTPAVKIARSIDAGDSFAAPLTIDSGAAVQGRIDVVLGAEAAWALWTREDEAGQSLQLARYSPDLSRELQRIEVARLQGRGRGTGFAQLALVDGVVHVAWTDVVDGKPALHGAVLQPAAADATTSAATVSLAID
ncbi:sialidase family protein [Novilysobacter erysipheiresistens]|uniref:Sialidase family protein n=1 Tax=Novilysobacter erysipheiresistens TaxID=1749332 RepID=A0ABU7YY91_9GAMM